MPLTWDATAVAESVRLGTRHDDKGEAYEGLSVTTETLIFASMMTGIGTITEKNAPEVFARIALWEALNGALRFGPEGPWFFSESEVRDHVGLKTNASFQDETRAKWLKRCAGQALDDRASQYNRASRTAAAPAPATA